MTTLAEQYFIQRVEEEVQRRVGLSVHKRPLIDILVNVNNHVKESFELYQDFKTQGLTFNSLEAEGAYRALLTLYNELIAYYVPDDLKDEVRDVYALTPID